MKAFILSAGFGTRLLPITKKIPKVMIKIGGKSVLEHLIILCKKHKIEEIVINLHHLPEKIKDYFKDGSKWGVKIFYSFEPKIMGSAGALKKTKHNLKDDDFFVLNGDVMTDLNLSEMWKFHKEKKGIGTFLIHKSTHPYDSSILEVDQNWQIINFNKKVKPGKKYLNLSKSGTHIFKPEILAYIPENQPYSLEDELIPRLMVLKLPLYGYYSEDYSHDMGTLQRLKKVREDFRNGKIKI